MPTVDSNLFPKVLFVEGAAPATPSSGDQAVFIDSADHKIKRKDSSGTVTIIEGGGGGGGALNYHTVVMSADTALTNSAWNDLISQSVAAGTWLVVGQARIYNAGSTGTVGLRLIDSTTGAVFGGAVPVTIPGSSAFAPFVHGIIVATGTETIKLQAQPDAGTMTAYKAGYPGSDNFATQFTLVQIA